MLYLSPLREYLLSKGGGVFGDQTTDPYQFGLYNPVVQGTVFYDQSGNVLGAEQSAAPSANKHPCLLGVNSNTLEAVEEVMDYRI